MWKKTLLWDREWLVGPKSSTLKWNRMPSLMPAWWTKCWRPSDFWARKENSSVQKRLRVEHSASQHKHVIYKAYKIESIIINCQKSRQINLSPSAVCLPNVTNNTSRTQHRKIKYNKKFCLSFKQTIALN